MMSGRHPSTSHFYPLFESGHLPDDLQTVSECCAELARDMIASLNDGPELSAGLRKLLEAKDCFVRQALLDRTEGS